MRIKDIPWFNRPGFKLTRKGVESLDDAELLSIILGRGVKGESVLELSNRLFKDFNFDGLEKLSVKELAKECKWDYNKALEIVSFLELSKRHSKFTKNGFEGKINDKNKFEKKIITCAKDIYDIFSDKFGSYKQEVLNIVLLDTKNQVIGIKEIVTKGTLNSSLTHPREVFKDAIKESANSIILVHNHPSGDCSPSENDLEVTEDLVKLGEIMDIPIKDHVIISKSKFHSISI